MSLHYLIDGYNVINKIDDLIDQNLETQRESFLSLIERKSPQGARRNKVTVVFDGQINVCSPKRLGEIAVIFSKGETADDWIKRFVCDASNKKSIIVVTDDNEIRRAIRQEGAQICSANAFLSKIFADKIQLKKVQQKTEIEEKKINAIMKAIATGII